MLGKIEEQLANHRVWLDKNARRIEQRELQYIGEDLKDDSPQALQLITIGLNGLATVYGIRGIVKVVDANDDGWVDITRAIDYRGWSLKIRASGFFGPPVSTSINLTNEVSSAACLACCSETWSTSAGAILRRATSEPDAVYPPYWTQRRFEPFVLACLDLLDGVEPSEIASLESPYREVIEALEDDDRLREALSAACDYHVSNMEDADDEWAPEFKEPPFDLLPCEVMLVHEVRSRLGRPILDGFRHPLVQTLGRSTRLRTTVVGDHVLEKVKEVFARCHQNR